MAPRLLAAMATPPLLASLDPPPQGIANCRYVRYLTWTLTDFAAAAVGV